MKIRREFKIGIFAVIVIAVSWWGIKWLGGQNVLLTSNIYYVYYDDVSGLQESSRVKLRGVEVGNVRSIELERDRVLVEIAVESKYADMIPANSLAEIGSAGLMGGVEINILQGDAAEPIEAGAFFEGAIKPDMIGSLADKGTELMDGLNETVSGVNALLADNSASITALVSNLESMSASVDALLAAVSGDVDGIMGDVKDFTDALAENTGRIESIIENLDTFTGDVAAADLVSQLNTTVTTLNDVLGTLESGEGSIGQLLNDPALYTSLNEASDNLGALLEDLKLNPMRYVHFSLFGMSEEKAAEKAAKKAARAEKRAAKAAARNADAE